MENVGLKNTIELEFTFGTSSAILFNRLSTPSGLSEWFADDVNVDGNIYTFIWDKSEHQAELVSRKDNKHIRFRWLENGLPIDEEAYFEFRISSDEITGGVALYVTEHLVDDDVEDAATLWNCQITELKRILGV